MPYLNKVMEVTYERKHNESYMILEGRLEQSFETKMIEQNKIMSLLEMNSFSIDGQSKLSYKITRKENLADFVESHDLTAEMIERIIINLQIALAELGKYLIDETHIYLSPETVFLEKGTDSFKLSLCYYPKEFGTIQEQFKELMDFFVANISKADRSTTKQVYLAYDVCLKEDFTLSEILEILQQGQSIKENEKYKLDVQQTDIYEENQRLTEVKDIYVEKVSLEDEYIPQEDFMESEYMTDYYDYPEEKKGIFKRLIEMAQSFAKKQRDAHSVVASESEDFVIEPDYELEERTQLLSEAKPVGRLVYDGSSNEDDFIINKDVFHIGTARENDAVLKARTVSGTHAKIQKEGNDFFLIDKNSTNGSFVNSNPIPYRKPYKLKPMDIIKFASESYIFM